jgi:thioredoxin family protein
MSRARDARRKARRRDARSDPELAPERRLPRPPRSAVAAALIILVFTAATVRILGASSSASADVGREVSELLAGIPQSGTALGDPRAPITLQIFGDLECPTVRRFMISHLPAIIDTWVRRGVLRLDYRSLETDTGNEHIFYKQEIAALAAGRQNKLWNFVLTFMHEQVHGYISYATDGFLGGIAAQVPGLKRSRWIRDREDTRLFTRVAASLHVAYEEDMQATPAFLIGYTSAPTSERIGAKTERGPLLDAASLGPYMKALSEGISGESQTGALLKAVESRPGDTKAK